MRICGAHMYFYILCTPIRRTFHNLKCVSYFETFSYIWKKSNTNNVFANAVQHIIRLICRSFGTRIIILHSIKYYFIDRLSGIYYVRVSCLMVIITCRAMAVKAKKQKKKKQVVVDQLYIIPLPFRDNISHVCVYLCACVRSTGAIFSHINIPFKHCRKRNESVLQ